ncbi:MAG: VWA domain-containing protein [Candidatus Aminicenantes bacterium]|nr:VWA domain-containing protein [Candidatus Aminicenantes bacterium]
MKKMAFLAGLLIIFFLSSGAQESYYVTVTNISVPVRVLDGNKVVKNLTIEDFEIYEDGQPQEIEALYYTEKGDVKHKEGNRDFMPRVKRNFHLLFQITEFNPKISEAINHFFKEIFMPGDSVEVQTPMRTYGMPPDIVNKKSREEIAQDLVKIIRKDTKIGGSYYRNLIVDLKKMVRGISQSAGMETSSMADMESDSTQSMFGMEQLLPSYKETLQKLDELRVVEQKKILQFAERLKMQRGEKIVFFFYQREFRPEIQSRVLNRLMSLNQDNPHVMGGLQDLFQFYGRRDTYEVEKLQKAFADSSILFSFIFMNKEPENISGITMREQSEDVFEAFNKITETTGGIVDNSQNPAYAFQRASTFCDSSYILFYTPKVYKKDGGFRQIEVRLKDKPYKVIHRKGYYSEK